MDYLGIKNWGEFQHYKDRNPPWIKLHRALLDDYEFCALPDDTKAHLVLIWLLASQSGGRVPAEPTFLASKIGARKPPNLKLLIAAGFLIPERGASETLAESKQGASDMQAFARSREKRREEERQSARTRGPTEAHRALANQLGIACETEWAAFWDRVDAKGKPWFTNPDAAFSGWLRQERKYAERDGRVSAAPQAKKVAL